MNRSAILTPQIAPPEGYYQNNFQDLLQFVVRRYEQILPDRALNHYRGALRLPDSAQRLLARLLMRKGPIFRIDALRYAEIDDNLAACNLLLHNELAIECAPVASDVLLRLVRKQELAAWFDLPGTSRTAPKRDLETAIYRRYSERAINEVVATRMRWLALRSTDLWQLALYLFFDDPYQDWSAFVLRDLGRVEYEALALDSIAFANLEELQQALQALAMSAYSHRVKEQPALAEPLLSFYAELPESRVLRHRRERALLRIGRAMEQSGALDTALRAYGDTALHPSRERQVRIADKLGDSTRRDDLLARIRQAPVCAEESMFAARFGKRNAGFQPREVVLQTTQLEPNVEQQVLGMLLAEAPHGAWGMYVENALVRSLTGLAYWPAIFSELPGAFTNPFQTGPHDLWEEDFAVGPRAQHIAQIEALDDAGFERHLRAVLTAKQGLACALVSWSLLQEAQLDRLLVGMGLADIRKLTSYLIRNLTWRRRGLPDLMLCYGPEDYEFVEVKGPNDQLQMQQRVWLEVFAQMQVPACVAKLKVS